MNANSRTFASIWMFGLSLLCACPSQVNPLKIESFTATPANLPSGGGNITLAWNVTGASNLSIEPNIGTVSGTSLIVNVNSNRTFTLKASNAEASVTASTSVTVVGGVDTSAPTLLGQSPLPGATGVNKDTSIVLTFSEAMNKTQTQAAYTSSSVGIRPNEVGFVWNTDATVLTIKPNAPLNYASGIDPNSTTALEYAFSLANGASDLAGNPLAPVAANFKTLRQITARVPGDPIQDGSVEGATVSNNSTDMTITTSARGFLGFNLGSLPSTLQATNINAAKLRVNAQFPMVFSTEQIELEHVAYGATLTASATTGTALRNLGNLTQELPVENAWKTASVLPAIQDDWTNRTARGNRSQYRLRCTGCTVIFYTAESAMSGGDAQFKVPELLLEYLLP
jgi:Bacterial Ig-like domain